jgi:hypothetical protein
VAEYCVAELPSCHVLTVQPAGGRSATKTSWPNKVAKAPACRYRPHYFGATLGAGSLQLVALLLQDLLHFLQARRGQGGIIYARLR